MALISFYNWLVFFNRLAADISRYMSECAITQKQKTKLKTDGGNDLINIHQEEKKKAQDEALVGEIQFGEIKDPSVTVEEVSREDAKFENDEKEQALAAKERHALEQEAAAKAAADQAAAGCAVIT
mgnify:CR=1 FL=1